MQRLRGCTVTHAHTCLPPVAPPTLMPPHPLFRAPTDTLIMNGGARSELIHANQIVEASFSYGQYTLPLQSVL